jgi:hypothetical protein
LFLSIGDGTDFNTCIRYNGIRIEKEKFTMTQSETLDQLYQVLEETLYLQPDDLSTNQQGKLSTSQRERIEGQLRSALVGFGCLNLVSILPGIALAIFVDSLVVRGIIVVGMLIWLSTLYRTSRQIRNTRQTIMRDLQQGEVAALQGSIQKKTRGKRTEFLIGIEGKFFLIPQRVFELVPEGEQMVIYYLPQSQQFVGLEPAE